MLRRLYRVNEDRAGIKARSQSYLLCYTRERGKREEKEVLQHQTTSLCIHFVCHPRTIPHAPMYHPNIQRWSYTPSTQLLSIHPRHIIQRRNTSDHFLIITNYTTTFPQHPHAVPVSFNISAYPSHEILCTLQPITRNRDRDSIPLLGSRSSENYS